MPDAFASLADSPTAPARQAAAIVPHNTNALPLLPKAIYVGAAGDITLRAVDDAADVVFKSVPVGTILAVRASHVRASGTTAGSLVGLA